jgi:hypothetical protein
MMRLAMKLAWGEQLTIASLVRAVGMARVRDVLRQELQFPAFHDVGFLTK